MSLIGNILWIIFGGLWIIFGGLLGAIGWTLAGILMCITVVGIPFGLQCFKIAGLILAPFGREVSVGYFGAGGLLGNIIWIVFLGWELCLFHFFSGILLSVTIVGIPFGKQHFKLARLALLPFGSRF